MKIIGLIYRYLRYLRKAKTKYHVHSPFVYDFIVKVLQDKSHYDAYDTVSALRKELSRNYSPIEMIDFGSGAGKSKYKTRFRKVNDIARRTAQPPKFSRLLYRLVNYYQPRQIMELGTSLGLSTTSLALGNRNAYITTMEGCAGAASLARENFDNIGLENIRIIIGNFDQALPDFLKKDQQPLGMVFFDGNHRKEPTINYFNQCLERVNNESFFVFDDIHWSAEMEEAWEYIKTKEEVSITIDLFNLGIVFFRKDIAKQNFILRF